MRKKIYLAGPEVFLADPMSIAQRKQAICDAHGFIGMFPLDLDLGPEALEPSQAGWMISRNNEALMAECDLVIANITPFRGPSADVGTAFEMGFMRALGRPVLAYTNRAEPFFARTLALLGHQRGVDDVSGARDRSGMSIEKHGFVDNLMLEGAVLSSGATIPRLAVDEKDLYTDLRGFVACVEQARRLFPD
jgi:nucleoside 2-deoxyribosyltransferase